VVRDRASRTVPCDGDEQQIRDRVFDVLKPHGFRIDATILEKRRAQPQIRTTDERFYQYA